MCYRLLSFVSLFLFAFSPGKTQSFTIYNYSVPDGLASSEVYDIFQDSHGFLWFATDNGVTKFDGSQFQNFQVKDGLTDPVVFSFFEDFKKRIWFQTFSGRLSYFEGDSIKSYAFNDLLKPYTDRGIISFFIKANDEMVFAVREYTGTIDAKGKIDVTRVEEEGVYYVAGDEGHIVGVSDRVFPFNYLIIGGKKYPIEISEPQYQNRVFRATRWNGDLYFSMNQEVFRFDGKQVIKVIESSESVISIFCDKDNKFWVGYLNGGVERYDDPTFSNPWRPDFLESKSVTKVFNDHEGGLWVSTLENGVYYLPNLHIKHFKSAAGSRVKSVIQFNDDALVGDQMGRVYRIDSKTKKSTLVLTLDGPILSLYYDNETLWISSNSHLFTFDKNFKLKVRHDALASDFIRNKKGETMTFGGYRFRKFDTNNKEVFSQEIATPFRSMHLVDSTIFLAERLGLVLMNFDRQIIKRFEELSTIKIPNIQQFNDSTLLITTIGKGFILMNQFTHKYQTYNTDKEFLADYIYSSLLDDSVVWMGTEKGLIKLNKSELLKRDFSVQYLTRASGLISDKIDFISKVGNDILAFANETFSVIPANFSQFAQTTPAFYIEGIRVNGQSVKNKKSLELTHNKNNIEVSFRFVAFNNPNILMRYRLRKGEPWNYTTSKKILFTSLAPSAYTFDLQYSSNNQDWLQALPAVTFRILPPWYGRSYFQILAVISIFALAYSYFRYQRSIYHRTNHYLKIINEHQQKLIQSEIVALERERNRISKELHDRVGTNLTAIKLTVNQILQSHQDPHTKEVEEQFQIAIREIKEIIYGLTPPSLERYGLFTSLKNYVGKLNKNIPINISLKTFGKEIAGSDLNIILFRVLQELLNNSIKHSFAKNITIHINSFDDVLNIVYEDDGVGFSYDPLQSGLGLDNIESRIHSVNGTLKFDSGKFGISYSIDIPITVNKEVA
jgi:signal transduction histidine kinase/ligand-binding sensor domain-containing protein